MNEPTVRDALRLGTLEVVGRVVESSNFTFLTDIEHEGLKLQGIYKPEQGEQPLDDFPNGKLYGREVAAYELSVALGWPAIPETVVREEALYGVGSVQRFVDDVDFAKHYFTLEEDVWEWVDAFQAVSVFDIIANNADRKAGHCLLAASGDLWCIDHGLCFNTEPKLRTVLWDWEEEPVPEALLADIARVAEALPPVLEDLLTLREVEALQQRMVALVANPVFPALVTQRQYPWPLV